MFWRKLGTLTYLVVLAEWLPIAAVIVALQDVLLTTRLSLGALSASGLILLAAGIMLHAWTGKLLGWKALAGLPELNPEVLPRN